MKDDMDTCREKVKREEDHRELVKKIRETDKKSSPKALQDTQFMRQNSAVDPETLEIPFDV